MILEYQNNDIDIWCFGVFMFVGVLPLMDVEGGRWLRHKCGANLASTHALSQPNDSNGNSRQLLASYFQLL
jgi:hypothetical protein